MAAILPRRDELTLVFRVYHEWSFTISDNEAPVFYDCPTSELTTYYDGNGQVLPLNFTMPTATDNSGEFPVMTYDPSDLRTPYTFEQVDTNKTYIHEY